MSQQQVVVQRALSELLSEYNLVPPDEFSRDLEKAIAYIYQVLYRLIRKAFQESSKEFALKISCSFFLRLVKYSFELEQEIVEEFWFDSSLQTILTESKMENAIAKCIADALSSYDSFVRDGSGWVFYQVLNVKIMILKYRVFRGGCSLTQLPPKFRRLRSIIAADPNADERGMQDCFIRAVVLALVAKIKPQKKNRCRWAVLHQRLAELFSTKLSHVPVSLKQAVIFDKKMTMFATHIFGLVGREGKEDKIVPYYVSDFTPERKYCIDILFYKEHYFPIFNLGSLVRGYTSVNHRRLFVCPYCLSTFGKKGSFEVHQYLCLKNTQPLQFPIQGEHYKSFVNYKNMVEAPFVIYADLESSIGDKVFDETKKKLKYSQLHQCIAWACFTVCRVCPPLSSAKPTLFVGDNAIDSFYSYLQQEFFRILDCLNNINVPIRMRKEDVVRFEKSLSCEFCHCSFTEKNPKVRDHCHLSGWFRHVLCSNCNLTYAKTRPKVFVLFHGLSNYDSHFLVQKLNTISNLKNLKISVIPKTSEKYLSLTIGGLQFKDSYQFLNASLAQLVKDLKDKGSEHFVYTKHVFPKPEMEEIIFNKGVFPYSYLTSLKVLSEKELPDKKAFFNDLTQQHVTEEDYAFAQKAWDCHGCKSLEDYLILYLSLDVVLLADVMENFRSGCMKDYKLDPVHYFSAAHYTFDAYMKMSNITFELLTDVNQYFFCLKGIRGGVSMVSSKRYAVANNHYMADFDPKQKETYLIDLDANNLYGRCMMDFLPVGAFEFCFISQHLIDDILALSAEAEIGYFLEVDLEYPVALHDWHQDYPLAPFKCEKSKKELSPFCQKIVEEQNLKHSVGFTKLMCTLEDREHYVVHYRNLQLYLKLGLKLKKVHRVLKFKQAPVMKQYITFNSCKRAQAKNDFDSGLYKLLSNSLYGKTIERADNRTMIKLVHDIQQYEKYASLVTMKSCKVINPELVSLELKHPLLKIDKPVYLGTAILELAKFYMYDFHYNVIKPHFADKVRLLYTDTDSLLYEIECSDVYAHLDTLSDHFDFSNYDQDHVLYSDSNKKVPGCFKDETKGQIIKSFVGLRSKMYAIQMDKKNKELKAAKGVKKTVIECLRFDDYVQCLKSQESSHHDFLSIRSEKHKVFTSCQSKVSLSCFDDKRWILDNGIDTVPYGFQS